MANNVIPPGGLGVNFLPDFYQTPANKKFLQATIDQLYQPGTITKTSGFIGRENAKAANGSDIYVKASTRDRQNYQLEPGIVVKDSLANVTFFRDYQDYINQLGVFGANTNNHARLNKQELYSWDPHIDWDKFVNFQNYYWLPYGPTTVRIYGQQATAISTYTVELQSEGNVNEYLFTPNGLTLNPTIKLYRGQTYNFNVNSPANPFSIMLSRATGTSTRYSQGVINNGVTQGILKFTVPINAPDLLYYQSESDIAVGGAIEIYDVLADSYIDIDNEVLGKKKYTLSNGTELSNGMKVAFGGNITPEKYAKGSYYVEGVGTAIKLVPETILEIVSPYTTNQAIEFGASAFDTAPFDDATGFATLKDYIVINRASKDHNPWTRYNRWFHKDVIETSAKYNNDTVSLDQNARAVRPIIEFEADLKLFNMGTSAIVDIDLVDDFTTDVFSVIEGTSGYNIDGVQLVQGQTILFLADTDPLVKNNIFQVDFVNIQGTTRIALTQVATPVENQATIVLQGVKNQSLMYWFNGTTWIKAQQKTSINQAPLFDIFDDNGISYSNQSTYVGTTFVGTKIFSYEQGTGISDTVLGFPLTYLNVSNIGDIVFSFNLATDTWQWKKNSVAVTGHVNAGYLLSQDYAGNAKYVNGWQLCNTSTIQAAIRIYKNSGLKNKFDIDVYDNIVNLSDLQVKVYINGVRLDKSAWSLVKGTAYYQVVLSTPMHLTDVLTIRSFSAQPINANGYYEIPLNLQNNPLNDDITTFTLGEVTDHVNSIIENIPDYVSIRNSGNVSQYGTKFVQHSGPLSLALYHITSESNNVIKALETARDDYNSFKRNYINIAGSSGIDANPIQLTELFLQKLNANKPNTAPYYFSDMVPYGASTTTNLEVVDYRIKTYPLTSVFSLDVLSNKAVGVYQTKIATGTKSQLVHGRDYTFSNQGFVVIDDSVSLSNGDTITTVEYDSTDGCYIPATPTKLGMWPAYVPQIYLDTTLVNPQNVIQGHDGSIILAYNDFRDDLILELELRIYNNIKVKYDPTIFDSTNIVPGYNRTNDYSLSEFNQVLAPAFYQWSGLVGIDFTLPLNYDRGNQFTFNYSQDVAPNQSPTPGFWRGIYRWMFDTDRPHLCPWEMLGFSTEPSWWSSVYGPAPYTSDNLVLWDDLSTGTVRKPGSASVVLSKYARPILKGHIPVDQDGHLLSPIRCGLARGSETPSIGNDFVFGDVSPVEATWRRSSYYPFSVIVASMLLTPASTFGLLLDRSRTVRNLAGQLVYSETNLRIKPADVMIPSVYSSATRVQTAGIVNYIVDLISNIIFSNNQESYKSYQSNLALLTAQLSYRVGAFTNQDQFNLLLESKTPSAIGNVFIPQESYKIFLNSSSPTQKITYSGVIITKLSTGFEIKGYSKTQPYFNYYEHIESGVTINVGGISESVVTWTRGQQYIVGQVVQYNNVYYRTKIKNTATLEFESKYFVALPSLPIVGGVSATFRDKWNQTSVKVAPYGKQFSTVQSVVDFLLGYEQYLISQGFVFNDFNKKLSSVANWSTSAKEFMFWTLQNWSSGNTVWTEWAPNQPYNYGTIVRYNGSYYSAQYNILALGQFEFEQWTLLPGLSNVGSSVISLSPAANGITFNTTLAVVDDIKNPFNRYEIFKVDSTPIHPNELDSYRIGNTITYSPRTADGIYCASFYLIQNEHVAIVDNMDIFNDVIYNPPSGYRRDRIKLSGYVTEGWYGGLDIPGFIFDGAKVQGWQPWQDYNMADIIAYQGYYYSANSFIAGSATFVSSQWNRLSKQPSAQLLPNWTNTATQFTDFYGLDIDNFNTQQQVFAQHLIGYQTRQYLHNIIQDPVSEFKFYQGMIRDKGTQNVLNHLFGVLNADKVESLMFYEEWAIRVGQYGASSAFEDFEVIIDQAQYKNNPQGYYLTNSSKSDVSYVINQLVPNDIYLKPLGYNSKPFPVLEKSNQLLRSAGYVNPKDITIQLGSLSEIVNYSVAALANGQYVSVAFSANTWNVYRFTDLQIRVLNVTYVLETKTLTITTQNLLPLMAGDYIGIAQVASITGFYQVASVSLNSFTVVSASALVVSAPFTQSGQVVVYALTPQRTTSIDTLDTVSLTHLQPGTLVWTDDSGNGKWAVWQYNSVYSTQNIPDVSPATNFNFGSSLSINSQSTILAVGDSQGSLLMYDKAGSSVPWIRRGSISAPFVSKSGPISLNQLATISALSADGTWLVTGSPTAGYASTTYRGVYNSSSTYAINSIVSVVNSTNNYSYYQAMKPVPASTPPTDRSYWFISPYIPVSQLLGTDSTLAGQGVVSIYLKDSNNNYSLVDTIISPLPAAGEQFGSNIVFGNNSLYIGAIGYNSGAGRVYKLSYITTPQVTTQYNPVGSSASTLAVSTTSGIRPGMIVQGTGFTKGQTVQAVLTTTTLRLSGSPDTGITPSGILNFVTKSWTYDWSENYIGTPSSALGSTIAISADATTLAIKSIGKVNIYKNTGSGMTMLPAVLGSDAYFGMGLSVSADGSYIAISNDTVGPVSQSGGVTIYYYTNGAYTQYQSLVNHRPETNGLFGNKLAFMSDDTIVVYSKNGDSQISTPFDNNTTTFDKRSTNFVTLEVNSGRVDIYDRYKTKWVFGESLISTNLPSDGYGTGFAVGTNQVVISAPNATDQTLASGLVYSYGKTADAYTWSQYQQQDLVADISKIKKAFLYNRKLGTLVTYLDIIDPLQGKIAGPAQEEISYQTFYDPASYSYSDGTTAATVDVDAFWEDLPIGQLWWNLATTKFLENNFEDPAYRTSAWNTLAKGASVDIYEWVSSNLLPANWDIQADTPAGLAKGISGKSLYGNSAYSVKQNYDNISKTFYSTYYYWVKNKLVVPSNVAGRHMASRDVALLIANPRAQAYTCLAITGADSFSLINASQYLKNTDVVLAIEYWTIDKTDQNVHSQWKLISNDTLVNLPLHIERKWIDSLCGVDSEGRLVPDPQLPAKLRYGIENRPRQGMFVNRIEALKQFIERVNLLLIGYQVTESKDITPLEGYDPIPNVLHGLYDKAVDTYAELVYANIGSFSSASVTPVIVSGSVVGIVIINSGKGYVNAPYITIAGSGKGAVVQSTINSLGQLTGAKIINGGEGYNINTLCSIRSYSVLVVSDETVNNTWSIYSYDTVTSIYSKVLTQSYDVRNYWTYADWYATGYSQFTAPDITVQNFVDLNTAQDTFFRLARNGIEQPGQLIKVLNGNAGKWVLLYRYSTKITVDWTQSYRVIGIQDGTIQFNSDLYKFAGTVIGYDSNIFDTADFDVQATKELRIILNTIKDKILIDDLKQNYLDLFLSSLHYAHSEQPFIDWAFKTSFIRATHTVGALNQPVNYPVDNLRNFQDYVAEVKPYRTKVREYISQYTGIDIDQSAVTDFDLQPNYSNNQIKPVEAVYSNNSISVVDPTIQTYPWKFWYDNVGFSITEILIVNGGSGYANIPQVIISAPTGSNAVPATAVAYIANGQVNRIVLTNVDQYGSAGKGYLSAPTITIDGGLEIGGVPATAVAIIGNGLVRSNLTELRFDRVNQTYYLANLQQIDKFTGSGSKLQFVLTWAPDIRVGQSSVTVNSIPVLRELYTLKVVKSTVSGYTQYTGTITFVTAPALNTAIVVTYNKSQSVLTAADRIQYYYNPTTGQLGKDLTQLMTGVDYGGVIVSGLGFNIAGGWGASPYLTDSWDSRPVTFNDYAVQVAGNTHVFTLPYTPATGTSINIYFARQKKVSYVSDGAKLLYAYDSALQNISVNVVSTSTTSAVTTSYITAEVISGTTVKSGGYTLLVADTTGIVSGMIVKGTGFTKNQKVVNVINSTTLTIDNVADGFPVNSEPLTFSNLPGSFILTVASTAGLAIGDVVTASGIYSTAFAYGTTITKINSSKSVTLNQILYATLAAGTTVTFTQNLIQPNDVVINASGTVQLLQAYPAGSVITVVGQQLPVRLDDPNYGLVATNNWVPGTQYAVNNLVLVDGISYVCRKVNTSGTKFNLDFALGYWSLINSNAIIPTPVLGVSVITSVIEGGAGGASLSITFAGSVVGGEAATIEDTVLDGGIINDSPTNVIEIPATFTVLEGDEFILREASSDGSVPTPDANYDSKIDGGNLAYSTATGIAADDIILDGDGFVTPTSSPATEEVMPGQVVDTLAIKVYDKSPSGAASIKVNSYLTDGVNKVFAIGQTPNSPRAVIVKLGSNIQTYTTDYTVDYSNKLIRFKNIPTVGQSVTVFSIGFNGKNILDLDYFIGDGTTTEFITRAPWLTSLTPLVYVNGVTAAVELFQTDTTYAFSHAVGLRFVTPPAIGTLINYIIVSGSQQTFAITKTEIVSTTGTSTYKLQYPIGKSLPNESSMIVRVDQSILQAPTNIYFTISNLNYKYTVDPAKALPYSTSIGNIYVYAGGNQLVFGNDYTIDPSGISVTITADVYTTYAGKQLVVSIISNNGYTYNPNSNEITFASGVIVGSSQTVEVVSNYLHETLDIQRTDVQYSASYTLTPGTVAFYQYNAIGGGLIRLDRPVIDAGYVWVIKNLVLLSPGADYKLNDDLQSIRLTQPISLSDNLEILTFSSNVLPSSGIAYMQFKDMLNRVTYRRLNANKKTSLVQALKWNDTQIVVSDASVLDQPNAANNNPGVIEIRGERIEYFQINYATNTLSQLRRGTLGTGVYNMNLEGSFVQNISSSEAIPYTDTTITGTILSSGLGVPRVTGSIISTTTKVDQPISSFSIESTTGLLKVTTGNYYVGQVIAVSGFPIHASLTGVTALNSTGQFSCIASPTSFLVGQSIIINSSTTNAILSNVSIIGTSGQFSCLSSPTPMIVGQQITMTGLVVVTQYLSGVIITDTNGGFSCTSSTVLLAPGQIVTISGTFGSGASVGSIIDYASPSSYTITATNGRTTFSLAKIGGGQVTTTVGIPANLTYVLTAGSGSVQNYVNPTTYVISETDGSTTFTLKTLSGNALVTTQGIPATASTIPTGLKLVLVSGTIAGYSGTQTRYYISATNGSTRFTLSSTYPAVTPIVTTLGSMYGQQYSLSGAGFNNYLNPTNYYVVDTNGTNLITLSTAPNGSPIASAVGTPSGLTANVVISIVTLNSNDGLSTGQKLVVTGEGGGGLKPGSYYIVNPSVGPNQVTLASSLALAQADKPINTLTSSTLSNTTFSSGGQDIGIGFVPDNADQIDVFVGGYNTTIWEPNTKYSIGQLVSTGPYTYRCIVDHTSSTAFGKDLANWYFFVENTRLKKSSYSIFDVNKAPYSPAGDRDFPADFIVDGVTATVTLTNPLSLGTQVTVIKKTGIAWDGNKNAPVNILNDSSAIANFIKAAPGIWYTEYKQISNSTIKGNFDNTTVLFDNNNTITFDQG